MGTPMIEHSAGMTETQPKLQAGWYDQSTRRKRTPLFDPNEPR